MEATAKKDTKDTKASAKSDKDLKWTPEKLATLKAARAAGKTWKEVGAVYGIPDYLARALVTRPFYTKKLKGADVDTASVKKKLGKLIEQASSVPAPKAKATRKPAAPRKKK